MNWRLFLAFSKQQKTPPTPDELEVSLFGPGVGECVILHIGQGEWMVVDSCVDTSSKRPIALDYLTALNVDLAEQLKWIVVTHWHNDHMKGASEILRQATGATLYCSAALQTKEFYELVSASRRERVGTFDLPEFAEIFQILRSRNPGGRVTSTGLEWVMSDRVIYNRVASASREATLVYALSPSSDTISIAHLEIAEFLPEYKAPKRRAVAASPNRVAMVLWVSFGDAKVLLGSDLEDCGVPTMGWTGILASKSRPQDHAHIFKVAHHGSETAHNDEIWDQMLQSDAIAILAPYLGGPKPLPSDSDISRLKGKTTRGYCTAPPSGFRSLPKRDPAVERIVRREIRSVSGAMGHIRVRLDSRSGSAAKVELFSPAHPL